MSNRLDQEREAELSPKRMQVAKDAILNKGLRIIFMDTVKISFIYKNETIQYYPYSGWATGKSIKDGRGLHNLLKQLL